MIDNASHDRSRRGRRAAAVFASLICVVAFSARPVVADDTQIWTIGRYDYDLTERWAWQLLARFRFDEDVSRANDFTLRNFSHWRIAAWDLGVGYDYFYSYVDSTTIEHTPFQLAEHRWVPSGSPAPGALSIKNRIRLDERFRADADGVIARLRYRLRVTHGIDRGWYLAFSDEVFANVNDRGSGPPHGFDQKRRAVSLRR